MTQPRRPSPVSCCRCAPLWEGGPTTEDTGLSLFGVLQRSGQQSGDPGHGEALRLFCPYCVPGAECVPGRCRSCPVSCQLPHRNHCEAVTEVATRRVRVLLREAAATKPWHCVFGCVRESRNLRVFGDIFKFHIFKCWQLIQNLKMSDSVWAKQTMHVDQIQPILFS